MKNTLNTVLLVGAYAVCVASAGCVIDDTGRARGQSNAPSATVPDTGSPVRRESASDTLDKAEPPSPAAGEGVNLDQPAR